RSARGPCGSGVRWRSRDAAPALASGWPRASCDVALGDHAGAPLGVAEDAPELGPVCLDPGIELRRGERVSELSPALWGSAALLGHGGAGPARGPRGRPRGVC